MLRAGIATGRLGNDNCAHLRPQPNREHILHHELHHGTAHLSDNLRQGFAFAVIALCLTS
jgi:hypothetical protein